MTAAQGAGGDAVGGLSGTSAGTPGLPFGGALGWDSNAGQPTVVVRASADGSDLSTPRGRTRVTSKAITRVATALGAEALDVSTRSVSVRLSDDDGMLAVTVSGPIRVAALNDLVDAGSTRAGTGTGSVLPPGETILERCERAQRHIRDVAASLTGASISRVTVHLTGIRTTQKERVK